MGTLLGFICAKSQENDSRIMGTGGGLYANMGECVVADWRGGWLVPRWLWGSLVCFFCQRCFASGIAKGGGFAQGLAVMAPGIFSTPTSISPKRTFCTPPPRLVGVRLKKISPPDPTATIIFHFTQPAAKPNLMTPPSYPFWAFFACF